MQVNDPINTIESDKALQPENRQARERFEKL